MPNNYVGVPATVLGISFDVVAMPWRPLSAARSTVLLIAKLDPEWPSCVCVTCRYTVIFDRTQLIVMAFVLQCAYVTLVTYNFRRNSILSPTQWLLEQRTWFIRRVHWIHVETMHLPLRPRHGPLCSVSTIWYRVMLKSMQFHFISDTIYEV